MANIFIEKIDDNKLHQDLEKYHRRAMKLGATDASIVPTNMIVIDERVVAKCCYPKCPSYGTNLNCPPYAMSVDDIKKVINNFRYGILIKVDVPSNHIAGKEAIDQKMVNPYIRKVAEITAKIESEAFYDGYHLALAFSSGSCKGLFCPDIDCQALLPGKGCPHRLKARSSMEAVGIDVYKTVSRVGWDIYPIGDNTSPKDVPFGLRVGIVLID